MIELQEREITPAITAPKAPPRPPMRDRARARFRRFRRRPDRLELTLALVGFVALCVLVLTRATAMLEPDDYAYRASIVALSQGHLLLSNAQYEALFRSLGNIAQWDHLANGKWISEKDPGYPFFAVIFYWLHALRLAPLFYGALACIGLYAGGRRWIGRYGGTFAVILYCTCGAAITFAWRATMPSFTDASLIAAGAGALLWTLLATEASRRRRLWVGLFSFVALEAATLIRYTNVVELCLGCVVVIFCARRCRVDVRMLLWWASTVAIFAVGLLIFDALVYGSPFQSGYRSGEITFSLSAIDPNLRLMPDKLLGAMPMIIPGLLALGWICWRTIAARHDNTGAMRDGVVALWLLCGWAGIWALYSAYTWTADQSDGGAVHVVRFYLPAMGMIALLGAWAMARIFRLYSIAGVAALVTLGVLSFHAMATEGVGGLGHLGGVPRPLPLGRASIVQQGGAGLRNGGAGGFSTSGAPPAAS